MDHHKTVVFINRGKFELADPVQTGRSLKELAKIPLDDVLFLQRPHADEVIANDAHVTLKDGDHLHSQPPANYGKGVVDATELGVGGKFDVLAQADEWTFVVVHDFEIPPPYEPRRARLLLKLPPLFPEAQPDMFWLSPAIRLPGGGAPKGTGLEAVLAENWQRFSWHLLPGAWKPGQSGLRDFMRCIRSRLERRD